MVTKSRCAFLRSDGYCPALKGPCRCENSYSACELAVKRAQTPKNPYGKSRQTYDRNTQQGRQQFIVHEVGRRRLYSQCTGKTRYETQSRATHVKHLRMTSGSAPLRVYYCCFCGGYHLTHKMALPRNRTDVA